MHDHSLSWLDTGTSIKSEGVKIVVWAQTSRRSEMMLSCKCFSHVSKPSHITKRRRVWRYQRGKSESV